MKHQKLQKCTEMIEIPISELKGIKILRTLSSELEIPRSSLVD